MGLRSFDSLEAAADLIQSVMPPRIEFIAFEIGYLLDSRSIQRVPPEIVVQSVRQLCAPRASDPFGHKAKARIRPCPDYPNDRSLLARHFGVQCSEWETQAQVPTSEPYTGLLGALFGVLGTQWVTHENIAATKLAQTQADRKLAVTQINGEKAQLIALASSIRSTLDRAAMYQHFALQTRDNSGNKEMSKCHEMMWTDFRSKRGMLSNIIENWCRSLSDFTRRSPSLT